ncbi:MAG: hypothetical protein R2715_14145 [Ilumatobacteraceae bacterium]
MGRGRCAAVEHRGRGALADVTPLVSIPATPAALLGVLDADGQIASVAMFALAPAEADSQPVGGTVVVVPAGGDTYLPDGTRGRLGDSYRLEGISGFLSTAEGLLGVSFEAGAVLPAGGVGALLGDVGQIQVDLPTAVLSDQRGTVVTRFPAGPTRLTADEIGEVLAATSSTVGEVDRLPDVDAVWRAISARVGSGLTSGLQPGDGGASETSGDFEGFVRSLLAGPLQVHTLSVEPVTSSTENPDGLDLLRLDTGEVTVVMATIAPSSVSPPFPTLSFYVKSSLGDPAMTKDAVERLLLAGANVVLVTENPDEAPPSVTQVIYADPNDSDESERFAGQLGAYVSSEAEVRIDGVDVTYVLGESYREERRDAVAAGTSSSTTEASGSVGSTTGTDATVSTDD